MEDYQARGYLFESIIWDLLLANNYINPTPQRTLRGRGAEHQIDAYGYFAYPIPFIYPIRLLSEAKCYKKGKNIDLGKVRNFVAVIKDISEYYFVNDDGVRNTQRFTDVGCIFSSTPFTEDAQNFAWAHNIGLVPFTTAEFSPLLQSLFDYIDEKKTEIKNFDKEQLNQHFKNSEYYRSIQGNIPNLSFGTVNEFYPIVLISKNKWLVDEKIPPYSDTVSGIKVSRSDFELGTKFKLMIFNEDVSFNLPLYMAWKIISKIENRIENQNIFELYVPVLFTPPKSIENTNPEKIRRILRVKIDIPDPDYLTKERLKIESQLTILKEKTLNEKTKK